MGDESPRRRDVLRSGVAAGLVWLGGATGRGLAQDETTTVQDGTTTAQSGQGRYAFSYGLQRGDRFVIRFRPSDSAGDPATETVPPDCLDGGGTQRYQLFVVRANRGSIDLGYRDLFVPPAATGTETPDATPTAEATTTRGTASEGTTAAETTAPERTTAVAGETTEAALQETTPETETTLAGETTTTEEETTLAEKTTTPGDERTPAGESALPEIQSGEWYRVTSSVRCSNLNRLTLEPAESPETTSGHR